MLDDLNIRKASSADYDSLAEVMFDAVRNTVGEYSDVQRAAWVPVVREGNDWQRRLDEQTLFMAESETLVAGFVGFTLIGYIDFAYVRPSFQGRGVFRKLYQQVEMLALKKGLQRLWAHVSLDARQAFDGLGFIELRRETVCMQDQVLARYLMEKCLTK